jgi:glycogen debranching enzyme
MLGHDLVLKHDELYLVGETRTDFSRERATGLYLRDTRFLSAWELRINSVFPESLDARLLGPDRALVVGANGDLPASARLSAPVPPRTVSVEQHVALDSALRVRVVLGNYAGRRLPLDVSLAIGADFRDLFDIRGYFRGSRGAFLPLSRHPAGFDLGYQDRSGTVTRLDVACNLPPTTLAGTDDPALTGATLNFAVDLAAGAAWELEVTLTPIPADDRPVTRRVGRPRDEPARIVTDQPWVNRILDRAGADLSMLQTPFRDGTLPAAGIPWYVAPFGRDSLITALQTLHVAPDRAVETLRILARLQGESVDRAREEEPGKIPHEMRYGELARMREIPHTPYYGTVDATPLFVMLFAETVRWSGEGALYDELLPHVCRALDWIETWGDRDGDGLVEYNAEAADGARLVHQGWKDHFDSLNDADGRPVAGSIALVEVQGYVYAAYRWLADVANRHGDAAWAAALGERTQYVRQVVEERFWLPEKGYYAQALDAEKRPVPAIASNPGHLLYCGLPSPQRATAMAARLRRPDLDSGWGIRTLATGMPSYNPMSYHNGSVWPHDNSLIAAGLARYGERAGLDRVASALLAVADRLPGHRLPELYCGFARDAVVATDCPVPYPVSCSPQAWAAGSPFLIVRALLGLEPDPDRGVLRVAPYLPPWLGRIHLGGAQVLGHHFDLDVERDGEGYRISSDGPVELIEAAQ